MLRWALSRHAPNLAEVKGTSAMNGGGLAASGDLILGRNSVSHGGVRHVDLLGRCPKAYHP